MSQPSIALWGRQTRQNRDGSGKSHELQHRRRQYINAEQQKSKQAGPAPLDWQMNTLRRCGAETNLHLSPDNRYLPQVSAATTFSPPKLLHHPNETGTSTTQPTRTQHVQRFVLPNWQDDFFNDCWRLIDQQFDAEFFKVFSCNYPGALLLDEQTRLKGSPEAPPDAELGRFLWALTQALSAHHTYRQYWARSR